jgi:hypothetical protein
MKRKADAQRSRVYAWERQIVAPRDQSRIPRGAMQPMVDAIWADLGLRWPPKVEPMPKNARKTFATGSRLRLRMPTEAPSWVLLHELAHALTCTHEGHSAEHGPIYVGVYAMLLERYMRFERSDLLASLASSSIEVDMKARPVFLDLAA